jgi:hypothetical protein
MGSDHGRVLEFRDLMVTGWVRFLAPLLGVAIIAELLADADLDLAAFVVVGVGGVALALAQSRGRLLKVSL